MLCAFSLKPSCSDLLDIEARLLTVPSEDLPALEVEILQGQVRLAFRN